MRTVLLYVGTFLFFMGIFLVLQPYIYNSIKTYDYVIIESNDLEFSIRGDQEECLGSVVVLKRGDFNSSLYLYLDYSVEGEDSSNDLYLTLLNSMDSLYKGNLLDVPDKILVDDSAEERDVISIYYRVERDYIYNSICNRVDFSIELSSEGGSNIYPLHRLDERDLKRGERFIFLSFVGVGVLFIRGRFY